MTVRSVSNSPEGVSTGMPDDSALLQNQSDADTDAFLSFFNHYQTDTHPTDFPLNTHAPDALIGAFPEIQAADVDSFFSSVEQHQQRNTLSSEEAISAFELSLLPSTSVSHIPAALKLPSPLPAPVTLKSPSGSAILTPLKHTLPLPPAVLKRPSTSIISAPLKRTLSLPIAPAVVQPLVAVNLTGQTYSSFLSGISINGDKLFSKGRTEQIQEWRTLLTALKPDWNGLKQILKTRGWISGNIGLRGINITREDQAFKILFLAYLMLKDEYKGPIRHFVGIAEDLFGKEVQTSADPRSNRMNSASTWYKYALGFALTDMVRRINDSDPN